MQVCFGSCLLTEAVVHASAGDAAGRGQGAGAAGGAAAAAAAWRSHTFQGFRQIYSPSPSQEPLPAEDQETGAAGGAAAAKVVSITGSSFFWSRHPDQYYCRSRCRQRTGSWRCWRRCCCRCAPLWCRPPAASGRRQPPARQPDTSSGANHACFLQGPKSPKSYYTLKLA